MNKGEITEIRRLYKRREECYIKQIAYGYIDANKQIVCTKRQLFMNMDESEQFKYLELIRKGMSGSIGKNIETMAIQDSEKRKALLSMINDNLKNEGVLQNFYLEVAKLYPECENILVVLIINTYDIPARGSDGHKNIEDSDEVYDFMQCFICPVTLEEPGLQYNESKDCFEKKEIRWCVGTPYGSFLYPSFEDRSSDIEKITVFVKKPDNSFANTFPELVGVDVEPEIMKEQEVLQKIMEVAVDDSSDKIKAINIIQQKVLEKVKDNKEQILTKEILEDILEESGIQENRVEKALNCFQEEKELHPAALMKKDINIKLQDGSIKVKDSIKDHIGTAVIDGRKCIVIDIEDEENVEINGLKIEL